MSKPKRARRVGQHRAAELFIGGICGLLSLAERLELRPSVGATLMSALSMALPDLSLKGAVAAYHRIGGEMPPELGAKVLAATARKPRRKARRRP